jgi:cobalamin biosynthesis protein CobT
MDRRKVLLGSGTAIATVLAGCAGETGQESETHQNDKKDDESDEKESEQESEKETEKDDEKGEKKEKKEKKDDKKKKETVPGFERDDFQIDSDIIKVKEVSYYDRKLDIRVMLTTNDADKVIDELEALAPGLEHAVEDAEAFLTAVDEIKFTLLDEHKNRVFAFFLDVAWLRKFLHGEMTNDELVDRLRDSMEQL